MDAIRNFMAKLMDRRYGVDAFSLGLLVLYLLLSLISQLTGQYWLYFFSLLPLAYCIFRIFSRQTDKRRQENVKFMALVSPAAHAVSTQVSHLRDKNYHYYKCASCGQTLRVPKGKGKIEITCPKCKKSFTKKS